MSPTAISPILLLLSTPYSMVAQVRDRKRMGLSTTAFPSGVRTTPTEINEVTSPLIFWRREFKQDSGGAGRLRGGLGQVIEIEHTQGASFAISKMFERVIHPARGRGWWLGWRERTSRYQGRRGISWQRQRTHSSRCYVSHGDAWWRGNRVAARTRRGKDR